MSCRRRPLHTCGVSFLRMADTIYHLIIQQSQPPSKLASLLAPFVYAMQYQWLSLLSFADDHIFLSAQHTMQTFFPPSKHLFDKIDDILQTTETFPQKFDGFLNRFPAIIHHQAPFLDWALLRVISMLKLVITRSQSTREKEIMVDMNSHNKNEDENNTTEAGCVNVKADVVGKASYKEVLEKPKKEVDDHHKVEQDETQSPKDDPILHLFESGWLMKPKRKQTPL
ncbi:hypothetical protein UlMin_044720 [Ulmus minor]